MDAFSDFERTVGIPVLKERPVTIRRIDSQVLVDDNMKKKWEEAKNGKETTAALIAVNEMVLHDLNQVINCPTGPLVQLVEQYARLLLAGSYSTQVRSAVRFLEQKEKKGISQDKLEKVKESLDHLKRKLEFLNKVEKDAHQGGSG
jgi:DNA repair ATPase RecN